MSVQVSGRDRSWFVVPPASSQEPLDLVVGFHGRGGKGEQVAREWGIAEEAGGGALGLYPDGLSQPWFHDFVGWDTRSEKSLDLPLFDALLVWAGQHYCIDPRRVHVIGHSWGAGMANLVACARPGIRSVVSVGGGGPTFPCHGPVGAMIVHGTLDQEEPMASGQAALAAWSFYARCGAQQDPTLDGNCVQFKDCALGSPVLWCEHPGGHGWPAMLGGGRLWGWLRRSS